MKYTITGSNLQFVNAEIEPGETLQSQAGAMVTMSGNVTMASKMEGGFLSGLKRSLSGSSFMLVNYTAANGPGTVSLAGNAPGKILDIDVGKGAWLCQKTAYLCSEKSVNLDMAFQKKLGSLFFGGEGFILQKLSVPDRCSRSPPPTPSHGRRACSTTSHRPESRTHSSAERDSS